MRHLIFLIVLPFAAFGQSPISDTSYVVKTGNLFYLITNTGYSDGGYAERMTLIGDSVRFYDAALNRFENTAIDIANKATAAALYSREIGAAIRENTGIIAATGKNPVDTLTRRAITHIVIAGSNWSLTTPTGTNAILFNQTASGGIRYSVDGSAARNVTAFNKYVIRLTAYPSTGQFLDLYWDEGRNRYISQDGKISLRRQ